MTLPRSESNDSDAGHQGLGLSPHRLRKVQGLIQAQLGCKLNLAALAEAACLSPYHFSRMFKYATGLSPHQYLYRARIAQARYLLIASELPIAEIARTVGFGRAGELSKCFRRSFGVTPQGYRSAVKTRPRRGR